MEITTLIDFDIRDDHIKTSMGLFYLFRILPPNLSILTDYEKSRQVKNFESFLDSNDRPFQIFVLDKTEDLSLNKLYWQGISDRYDYISNSILAAIDEMQGNSSGVQRAYYNIICVKKKSEHEMFFEQLKNNEFECYVTQKLELITVMRNFFLREFTDFDISTFDKEVQKLYERQKAN